MSRDLFGFKAEPFSVYPDNKYFFSSISHDKAISLLEYGINSRKGFMLLTGLKGSGKTMACNVLSENLKQCNVAVITENIKDPEKLITEICSGFGLDCASCDTQSSFGMLMDYFVGGYKDGMNNLIIIDDAENISDGSLELLNSFMEIEIEKCKLVQVILCGSPDMHDKMKNISSRLGPKFTFTVELAALSMKDTAEYVEHRIKKALGEDFPIFRKPAFIEIYHYSKGIPSEINRVAQKAIEIANEKKSSRVAPNHVKMAAANLYGVSRKRSITYALPVTVLIIFISIYGGYVLMNMKPSGKTITAKNDVPSEIVSPVETPAQPDTPAVIETPAQETAPAEPVAVPVKPAAEPVKPQPVAPVVVPPVAEKPVPAAKPEPVKAKYGCITTASGLKMRSKPSVTSESLTNAPYMARIDLIKMTENKEWWECEYNGAHGFMYAKFIEVTESGTCK
ncbi:MAG: AAA family ATPase [Deferribacterales bacterium]